MPDKPLPEWEALLSSAARLQKIVPGAVLVGGTAAATYAHHRVSLDHRVRDICAHIAVDVIHPML